MGVCCGRRQPPTRWGHCIAFTSSIKRRRRPAEFANDFIVPALLKITFEFLLSTILHVHRVVRDRLGRNLFEAVRRLSLQPPAERLRSANLLSKSAATHTSSPVRSSWLGCAQTCVWPLTADSA